MLINPCPADIYLTMETLGQCFKSVFAHFKSVFQISHCIGIFIVDFELVSAGWVRIMKM